jgi:translation initiation factor 1 (eIF-1/SUI1)
MAEKRTTRKIIIYVITFVFLGALLYAGRGWFYGARTIHELLTENKQLKKAITNLTQEEQIGYAKVISQERRDGKLLTTIRFVENAGNDKLKKVLEKDYTTEGNIIHFDALIVKFGEKMVMDGKKKALYLWRRVYSENTAPEKGLAIEEPGQEPQRYGALLKLLPIKERNLFWTNIWELANDPDKLKQYDIEAIYGNVVYSKLKPGFIYIFKITPSGQLYPETLPEM